MKECKYCRTKYNDNLAVCPNCGGNKVFSAEEKAEEQALYRKEIESREKANAIPEIRKKRLFVAIGAVVAIIVIIIAVASYNANKPLSNGMTVDEGEKLLEEGIAYYESGDYETAMECFVQLPSDSKQYKKAQSMLEKSEEAYKTSVLEKVETYVQNEEYKVALELLLNARALLPDDTELTNVYNTTQDSYATLVRGNAISEAENYVNEGDYPSAIFAINEAIDLIGRDEELVAKLSVYEESYTTAVIKSAKEQYIEYNFESIMAAEDVLNAALDVFPENKKLLAELEYYKEREPVKLLDLATDPLIRHDVSTYEFEYAGNIQDVSGVSYESAIAPSGWYENYHPYGWSTTYSSAHYSWVLDYQYTKITGVFLFCNEYKNASIEAKLTITPSSGSEETFIITNVSDAKNFEVDLTGSKDFEITIRQSEIDGTYVYLADVYVWK